MTEETETTKDLKQNYTVKDKWDKLEIMLHPIGGFFTGLAIAALGYFGSAALEERQTNEINMRLYSELMNQREQAENKLRSDMFQQIFDSFLAKSTTSQEKDQNIIKKENELDITNDIYKANELARELLKLINVDLLRLELLTRNFHESIDIKPIFQEILFKILRVRSPLRAVSCAAILKKTNNGTENKKTNKQDAEKIMECQELKKSSRHGPTIERFEDALNDSDDDDAPENATTTDPSKYSRKLLRDANRKINKLRTIAHRISDKQLENLANKNNFLKMSIPIKDLCNDASPNSSRKTKKNGCSNPKGFELVRMLTMTANDRVYQRIFRINITNSYTKWNQVHVNVQATKPNEDIACEDNSEDIHNTCADFWVSSFDFPLVDNTYLSEEERYGIAIDEIDEENDEIKLVLVYFPASYAGLKEKSFYHKKVLNHLDNWIVIKGTKE